MLGLYFAGWLNFLPAKLSTNADYFCCNPGPWGNLEYVRILTEPPDQQLPANIPSIDSAIWTFKGYDSAKLDALWSKAQLSSEQLENIRRPEYTQIKDGITLIKVFKDIVFGLTPESRNVIYSALSQFPENREQHEPFRFRADAEDEWWKNSGLNPETLAAVKRLIYRRGSAVLFSDISLLLPTIKSFEERTRLLKTLARKSTLLVKLQLNPQTDIEALENYWGGTGNKDIGPLLRSLTQHSNGATIDIVHLLPPFARSRLYTYPSINNPDSVTFMDCHWTVLNFFNSEPDKRYEDINEVTIAFRNNYYPVAGRPKFGDIYLFALPNGDIIHSCVFIADDIVFTKNGASATSPWILMNLQDVIAYYPSDQPLDIQRYRPKFL